MLCGGVAACHIYGMCTVRCVECDLALANNTHNIYITRCHTTA